MEKNITLDLILYNCIVFYDHILRDCVDDNILISHTVDCSNDALILILLKTSFTVPDEASLAERPTTTKEISTQTRPMVTPREKELQKQVKVLRQKVRRLNTQLAKAKMVSLS